MASGPVVAVVRRPLVVATRIGTNVHQVTSSLSNRIFSFSFFIIIIFALLLLLLLLLVLVFISFLRVKTYAFLAFNSPN